MKKTLFFFILLPFLGISQQDSSVFYTGRGNLKLSNGKFTITRPNGNLIAVFPNYLLKKQVDSLINNYNDTTDKSGISCVDSLWKVGNIVYHRNWNCDVQSFVIDPPTVDGCSGGRVYHKNILADTSFLTPSPVCGDILVVEGDTCKDYLYIKGNAPPKWNFIGAYLKNSNCFDPLPCKDSIWKIGLTYYYRNVDCFVFQLKDSVGSKNDTLYTLIADASQFRVSHKPDNLTYFTLKAGEGTYFSSGVVGANGEITINSKSSTADTLYTSIANSSQLKFTHKPANTTDVTLNAGAGIKFNNASVGANNVHGTVEIAVDTTNSAFKKNYYSVTNIGSGAKVYKNKTTNGDTTQFNLRSVLSNDGTITVTENSNDINISANVNNRDSISHDASIYQLTRKDYAKGTYIGGTTLTAGNNIEFSSPVPGPSGSIVINAIDKSTADTLYTSIANSSQLKFTHKPANTTDVTLNAGAGIKFNNASVGANNVHGVIEIAIDSTNSAFKKNYYSVNNIGSGARVYKNKTISGDTGVFNLRSITSNDGTITISENVNDINLSTNTNNRDSIWNDASIYQFKIKNYAKGALVGSSSFNAGPGIAFSSPVQGQAGSIVIGLESSPSCPTLPLGGFTGKYVMWDVNTQCMQIYSCPIDPCSPPPPLPPPTIVTDTLLNYPSENYVDGMQLLAYKTGVPSGYIGHDFDIAVDFPPATNATDLGYFGVSLNNVFYQVTAFPVTPIVATDQTAIQAHINASLVAAGFNANDLIWIANNDNTVTIWRSPSYTPIGDEFWCGDLTPNNWTNKYYPTIPTIHANTGNGLSKVKLPTTKAYQQYNVGATSVDLSAGANTPNGYVNFTTGDIPLNLSKMDVYINGVKHNYTVTPSSTTYLSYTLSGTTITAYSGSSPITINQIEVKVNPF